MGTISYWSYSKQNNSDLVLNGPNSAKQHQESRSASSKSVEFVHLSSSNFSILGNPIVFEPPTYSACLVLWQISAEPVIQKPKCQSDTWKSVWFQLLKPAELKGGKATWQWLGMLVPTLCSYTRNYYFLKLSFNECFLFINQGLWVLLLQPYIRWHPIWSQILKEGPMMSCTTTNEVFTSTP